MNLYFILIFIISLIGIKFYNKKFNKDYNNKSNSKAIKGIFILIVFFSHCLQYISLNNSLDLFAVKLTRWFDQLMVAMFLFYSGYGVMQSIANKKNDYIKSIPKKRILNTLINFNLALVAFVIINLIFKIDFSISKLILSLIGWENIGNSNWYIFVVLIMYLITYIAFTISKSNYTLANKLIWILSIVFILFLKCYKESFWYNTLLCYPFGITYSIYKNQIEKYTTYSNYNYIVILIVSLLSFIIIKKYEQNFIFYEFLAITFCFIVILLTMKFELKSKILIWFGNNLFWIYILQRIPMIVLTKYKLNAYPYTFCIISFAITIILSIIYKFIKELIKI